MGYKHVFSNEIKSSREGDETFEGADTTTHGTNIFRNAQKLVGEEEGWKKECSKENTEGKS